MKAQHTPGPWENDGGTIRSSCGVSVASVLNVAWPLGRKPENPEANARIIAAAPELLEALIELLEDANNYAADGIYHSPLTRSKARVAIAKATGV